MGDEKEPTQTTEQGLEIPVPTREQIERDFAKIMRPLPPKKRKVRHKRDEGQEPPSPA